LLYIILLYISKITSVGVSLLLDTDGSGWSVKSDEWSGSTEVSKPALKPSSVFLEVQVTNEN
jgi:hypothetical protein